MGNRAPHTATVPGLCPPYHHYTQFMPLPVPTHCHHIRFLPPPILPLYPFHTRFKPLHSPIMPPPCSSKSTVADVASRDPPGCWAQPEMDSMTAPQMAWDGASVLSGGKQEMETITLAQPGSDTQSTRQHPAPAWASSPQTKPPGERGRDGVSWRSSAAVRHGGPSAFPGA